MSYHGLVIGISAGTMNSADIVYSQPEEKGEAVDPTYKRFLSGLDLTKTMILPHYQATKDDVLDGLRIYEDIAYKDSFGRTFYALPDGSYLFIDKGKEMLFGEAYMIKDGRLTKVSDDGQVLEL